MLDSETEHHIAAERVADRIDLAVAKLLDDGRHVVAHLDGADRAVAEGTAPMAVHVDGDHLSCAK